MTRSKNRRWLSRLALGLAVAAIAVPSAQAVRLGPAEVIGSPQAGTSPGPGGYRVPDTSVTTGEISRPAPAHSLVARSDHEAGVLPGLPSVEELQQFRFDGPHSAVPGFPPLENVKQFSFDGPDPGSTVALPSAPDTPVSAPGFDWDDAGVGVGIGAGLSLVLAAGLMVVRRRGKLASA